MLKRLLALTLVVGLATQAGAVNNDVILAQLQTHATEVAKLAKEAGYSDAEVAALVVKSLNENNNMLVTTTRIKKAEIYKLAGAALVGAGVAVASYGIYKYFNPTKTDEAKDAEINYLNNELQIAKSTETEEVKKQKSEENKKNFDASLKKLQEKEAKKNEENNTHVDNTESNVEENNNEVKQDVLPVQEKQEEALLEKKAIVEENKEVVVEKIELPQQQVEQTEVQKLETQLLFLQNAAKDLKGHQKGANTRAQNNLKRQIKELKNN